MKIILVGRYYVIEPLGLLYLLGLAEKIGCEARVHLVKDSDFEPLMDEIAEWKPDFVGFSIWTGYHKQSFTACDRVRGMGVKVIIGGPHATYFTNDCQSHADYVVKGEGFRTFRRILQGEVGAGSIFDAERMAEGFPVPSRHLLYEKYPHLAESPIKSIFCSIGCPFSCSYCYAPAYNDLYGGFRLNLRPVGEVIAEALAIKERWPLSMIYFQDDIFGYDIKWLSEFVDQWSRFVQVPWHCQIRLELARNKPGRERLRLFRGGGCTGITLAVESGNPFLREFVLIRPMDDDTIDEGIGNIKEAGLKLRLEQIPAVPFSDLSTDLETLRLNCRYNPEMAWTSILAPYMGTAMGEIASSFGLYSGNNDDLTETFFDRSVLKHLKDGREKLEPIAVSRRKSGLDRRMGSPLTKMVAVQCGQDSAGVYFKDDLTRSEKICNVAYLSDAENQRYAEQTVMLQKIFMALARIPSGYKVASEYLTLNPRSGLGGALVRR